MQATWLLEANVEGLPAQPLEAEIRRQGRPVKFVKHFPGSGPPGDIAGSESLARDDAAIFIGTFALMRHIQSARRWRPGGWCHFGNLSCSRYYAPYGPFLLNRNYSFVPLVEAQRLVEGLFARHGRNGRVFVRPDGVDKLFTGTVVDADDFRLLLAPYAGDPERMILVAEPRPIADEWRLYLAHGRVIAACQYRAAGEFHQAPGCPEEVWAFAEDVVAESRWTPEPLFVMDVCSTDDQLAVVELGSFSCSGPLGCDLRAIVQTASEEAARAW